MLTNKNFVESDFDINTFQTPIHRWCTFVKLENPYAEYSFDNQIFRLKNFLMSFDANVMPGLAEV